jgi:hypothetical protein
MNIIGLPFFYVLELKLLAKILKGTRMNEMQEILKARIAKLKRDYQKKGKLEYLIRIKEDRSLLQYIRKNYGNIQQGG